MLNNDFLNTLSRQLAALMPMADELRKEARTKIEQQLRASFTSLDLLTRADFDAQARALQRAQERVQELEVQLARLEARITEFESQQGD